MPSAAIVVSKKALWAGRIISALPVLMLLFIGVRKLLKPAPVVQEFGRLGYPKKLAIGLGIVELGCTVIYIIPRTAVLGAILLQSISEERQLLTCVSAIRFSFR